MAWKGLQHVDRDRLTLKTPARSFCSIRPNIKKIVMFFENIGGLKLVDAGMVSLMKNSLLLCYKFVMGYSAISEYVYQKIQI